MSQKKTKEQVQAIVTELVDKYVFDLHEACKLYQNGNTEIAVKNTEKFQDEVGDVLYEVEFDDGIEFHYKNKLEDDIYVKIVGKECILGINEQIS